MSRRRYGRWNAAAADFDRVQRLRREELRDKLASTNAVAAKMQKRIKQHRLRRTSVD